MTEKPAGPLRRLTDAVGLTNPGDGSPLPGAPRRSRYLLFVSPRLDQDIDELRAKISELERRLDER